jgi:hypothetical protein
VAADIVRVEISVALEPPRFVFEASVPVAEWPSKEFRVQADPAETLNDLVARTAGATLRDAFGDDPRSSIYAVWLGRCDSDTPTELGEVPVFTADGRLRIVWGGAATIGQLLQAQAAGLLRADPRKVIVRPEPPAAAVGGGGWDIVVEALHILWKVVEDIGVTYAAYGALERVLSHFRVGTRVIEQQIDELEDSGIRPPELPRVLATRAWSTQELADALGISTGEVELLLRGFAFEKQDDGTWVQSDPRAAEIVAQLVRLASSYEAVFHENDRLAELYRNYLRSQLDASDTLNGE